jgi:RNA-directed DNA polymerase
MMMAPEPKDKLDATTMFVANGPEDELLGWGAVDWRACEEQVRCLRQRIFTASRAGDLRRVRNLQKLMLRSRANTLLSVRRVTERNAGRETAGVDGEVVLSAQAKMDLARELQCASEPWRALPVKRVYIPKQGSGKRRPLGIPVVFDRVQQARVVAALEPEWEARFEPRSYGFRPGRGCHDAIAAIYVTANGKSPKRRWVLDADLAAAFDRIAHDHILAMLGSFPARGLVEQWLKAGVIEDGRFTATEEGVPQGGVISPVLLNIALHGMEQAAGVRYWTSGRNAGWTATGSPVLVRYADDLVALCHTRDEALTVKARLAAWLAPRGLVFNEDKTRIVTLDEGFDFLGFNVRRYDDRKLLIKPSKAAIRRARERLRTELRSLRGTNAQAVLIRLNPVIRGWSAYYRGVVSSDTFSALDDYVWKLTYKWATYGHPNKSKGWVIRRYFGMFNRSRRDRWVFGDRASGVYLLKFAWTRIIRHQLVTGASSPDDPALNAYWAERRAKMPPPTIGKARWRLYKAQHGRCPLCGDWLQPAEDPPATPQEWEQWLATNRKTIKIAMHKDGTSSESEPRLLHTHCHHRHTAGNGNGPALLPARPAPGACLSRMR